MHTVPYQPKLSRLFRIQWEEAQGNYVLLYPEGMVKLNQSAAEILKRCDGLHSAQAIAGEVEEAFGASNLLPEIDDFLRAANERGWLA